MKWRTKSEISDEQVIELAQKLNIDALLARIILNRGLNEEQARVIVHDLHDAIIEPELMINAVTVADIIAKYCADETAEIWIFADYDADGITGGFTLTSALEEVSKCPIHLYYPERKEGYGLNEDFAKRIVSMYGDNANVLVITVDNGVAQVDQINYLIKHGIQVVVTDHHMSKEQVPNCIIVDPHNAHVNQDDTFKHLCGCGVAFKVAQLVQAKFGVYNMMKYTPYVAIGTLADVMPMHPENIALIKYGLEIINSDECPEGIKAFKDYVGKKTLTSTDIVWELAPRINACGRMGNTSLGSKLFFEADDYEDILNDIERINTERKSYTEKAKKLVDELDFSNDSICILDATEFPEGIIGIIAGKVVEKFKKPAIVVGGHGDAMKGSARTYGGVGLQEILRTEVENGNLINFGGHDTAAGVVINKEKFKDFKASINEQVSEIIANIPEDEIVEEQLIIDELIEIEHINEATYNLINELPYDKNTFSLPTFALTDVVVISTKHSKNNPNNICFKIKDERGKIMELWAWGMAEQYSALGNPKKLHIAGQIDRNFMNPKQFTLKVIDFVGA